MYSGDATELVLNVRRDTFATVTINREDKLNTLNLSTVHELIRIFSELRNDSQVKVVILTGAGDQFFSAGVDLEEISALTPEQATTFARAGQALTALIEDLGKPVIAAVNGLASGGGCEIAIACTWRVATAQAKFVQPEARLGLVPGFGGSTRLARMIGKSRAFEMILTGDPIIADEAALLGLVNRVVGDHIELISVCEELAKQISRNAPLAIKYALDAVNHGFEVSLNEGLNLESALFGLCFATEDFKEGTRAFLEKRDPVFRGK